MTKEEIGEVLKQLRMSCGMTQKEVATKISRTQQIVGHWETGYAQPDANTLFTLCKIYGTTVDEAFGFSSKTKKFSIEEINIIEKYHNLDSIGQSHVDAVLQWETERVQQIQPAASAPAATRMINYYYRLASAGTGQIIFDMPPTKRIEIPAVPEYRKADYAIGVNGNSMEPVYHDGDTLLVEMTDSVEIGEIGIFMVNGESFVKERGETELRSLNPESGNVPLNESARCLGRVIGRL